MRARIAWMLRVVLEARFAALVAGAVVAGFSTGSAWASPAIELSDVAAGIGGFAIDGEQSGDRAGRYVSSAGDVNGDGLDDLIVGASGADPNGLSAGRSYVVFSKANATLVQLSDVAAGIGGFAIDSEANTSGGASVVSAAGDVNGDGLADLIIGGAVFASPIFAGRSYVVFGKANGARVQLSDVAATGAGGFAIDGEANLDLSGSSVSGAGDVNGDGLADLIVGAPQSIYGSKSGRSYVIFGKAAGTLVQLSRIAAGIGGFVIRGEATGDGAGGSVSGAGDVNGDGLDDLIVGASGADPNGSSSGRSYVVFGKASGTVVELSNIADGTGADGFAIDGAAAIDQSGTSVSGAGDVNGDGFADLIVGAPLSRYCGVPGGCNYSGSSYVVFGKATGALVQLNSVAAGTGGFAIRGESTYDYSGHSVSAAGDVNGDGIADLIVGVHYASSSGTRSGRSYVVFGKNSGARVRLNSITAGTGGFAINGEAAFDFSGRSVSEAGDVNGDGLADLIVGAYRADPNGSDSGRAYVVFSREIPPLTPAPGVATSATYRARSRAGDGGGGNPVVRTRIDDARVTIDFSDSDQADNGSGGASTETIILMRNSSDISNLSARAGIADVMWEITTDRVGFDSADVTLKYLNSELGGLSENGLRIYTAPAQSGPWTPQPSTVDAARNEVTATVTGFSFFALGSNASNSVQDWLHYE